MNPQLFEAIYERPWNVEGGAWRSIHAAFSSPANLSIEDLFRGRPEASIDENGIGHVHLCGILGRHAPIAGVLGDTDYGAFADEVEEIASQARALMLHVDSGGGMAAGNIEAAEAFADVAIPTVAFADGYACSAAYAIPVGADYFIATPSSSIGSIGTIIPYVDQSGAWEQMGLKADFITSGDLKGAGYPPSMTEAQRASLQEVVNDTFAMFRDHVLRFRSVSEDAMRGQYFVTSRALSNNLVDAVGSYDDAYDAALKLANR